MTDFKFNFRHQTDGLVHFLIHDYKRRADAAGSARTRDYLLQAHSACHDELARRREQHGQREGRCNDGL
jgi:hypothetical protein